jgi:hypothetical protein
LKDTARVGIADFIDAAKDDRMGNIRRPGLGGNVNGCFADPATGTGIDTVYEWLNQNIAVVVSGGRLFKLDEQGALTEITGANFATGNPAYFADVTTSLYGANGGSIKKWIAGATTASDIADASAPTTVSHIVFADQHLLALNSLASRIERSNVGAPDTWDGKTFQAEFLPDESVALHAGWEELAIFGEASLETFYLSNEGVYVRLDGTSAERGTIAPHSVIKEDNTYFFMDHQRRVIRLEDRTPKIISNPFDLEFKALDTVSDCRGMNIFCDNTTFVVWTFPTENKTYAYDYKRDVWARWTTYDNETGNRNAWLGQTSCYMRKWNKHLVGGRDGKIYEVSNSFFKDGTAPMVTEIVTGWINHGSDLTFKRCAELAIRTLRGAGSAFSNPVMEVSYRKNGKTEWNDSPRTLNLGELGDTEHIKCLRNFGRYKTIQWRFRCSEDIEFNLISSEEKISR